MAVRVEQEAAADRLDFPVARGGHVEEVPESRVEGRRSTLDDDIDGDDAWRGAFDGADKGVAPGLLDIGLGVGRGGQCEPGGREDAAGQGGCDC